MSLKQLIQSPTYTSIIRALATIFIALLIFVGGVAVGYHRAAFSRAWDFNHAHNTHGANGTVVSVALPKMVVSGRDEREETVVVSSSTEVRGMHAMSSVSDIRAGDQVVVIGMPDEKGDILATFIRIMQ